MEKNYLRSLKGLQLLKEAFARLEFEAFFKNADHVTRYTELLDHLVQFRAKVAEKDRVESVSLLQQFKANSSDLIHEFDQYILQCSKESETFKYWDTFLHLMSYLENLVRSDREGNWNLQLQSIQDLLPLFAAFNSTNYLRWCSLYLEDMKRLPETAPGIHTAFMEGKFAVKRTPGCFKAVGADKALEQTINRAQKSVSGIIGSSKKKQYVAKWEIVCWRSPTSIEN